MAATIVSKPHALMASIPAHSHIYPMLQLGFNLISAGFMVTFASPERIHEHMMTLGQDRFHPQGHDSADFRIIKIADGLPVYTKNDRPQASRFGEAIAKIEAAVESLMESLMKQRPPVSCIISNTFLFGMQDIANKFAVPKIDFFPSAATLFAIDIHLTSCIAKGASPLQDLKDGEEVLIKDIPGLPPLKKSDMAKELWIDDVSDAMNHILVRPFERIRESKFILINTFYELESQVIDALRADKLPICPVGPLLPSCFGNPNNSKISEGHDLYEADACIKWLTTQEENSVVYVSFGSFVSLSKEEIRELALGLESSKRSFLWVIHHKEEMELANVLPKGFLERTNKRGKLVTWAPQVRVLAHAAVGVFLSHCGWNSTMESLAMGVPIIGWPLEQDQVTNLRLIVEKWGVGVALGHTLHRASIKSAIEGAMQSSGMYQRARSIGEIARNATATMCRGSSSVSFDTFVHAFQGHVI